MIFAQLTNWFNVLLQAADALVAADAQRQGISREEAWAGAAVAGQQQADQVLQWLADPLGWRAAAAAFERAA